jgi:hypothetical protein
MRVAACVLTAGLLGAVACGDDDGGLKIGDVAGVWLSCADRECDSFSGDGFALGDDGSFAEVRLESDNAEEVGYCEVPFGSFEVQGSATLIITRDAGQDSGSEPRTVDFEVDGERATLVDERGISSAYARVRGMSSGACTGVLDR